MIRKPASRILVDGVKEIFRGAEQSYRDDARTKRFEVFRKKLLPKLFAEPHEEDRSRRCRNIAVDSEIVCDLILDVRPPVAWPG